VQRKPWIEPAGAVSSVLLSVVLAVIAGYAFVASVSNSRFDSHENRAPELRIAFAAVALLAALTCTLAAGRWLRRHHGGNAGPRTALLIGLTVLLLVMYGAVALATGPL
jgi:hypothetical protein